MKNKDGLCWKAGEGIDYDRLLRTALELGFQLMSSGAEIYRVEESIRRLLRAYGLESPEVFAVPNCVIVSVTTPEGRPLTQMRRIPVHGINIELLERCNGLCRCPVTSYVLVALLPLVPGGGIYHAMRHCVTGESQQFLSTLLHTFGMAAALAVGAMLASSVFRATVSLFQSNRGHGSRRRGTGPQQTP